MNEIYEVTRDEYAGLMSEMKKELFEVEQSYLEDSTSVKLFSRKTGKLISERIIPQEGEEQYYIYNLPDNDERLAPKKIRQYKLETKEEVQAFFDILNKLQQHDGTIPEHQ